MFRRAWALVSVACLIDAAAPGAQPAAPPVDLSGHWVLNRGLSQFPKEVGFGMDLVKGVAGTSERDEPGAGGVSGGSLGRPGSGLSGLPESEDDARRRELLVGMVRVPPARLTIAQSGNVVTITDTRGRSITVHGDGRTEAHLIDQVPVTTTSRWDGARLEVRYRVQPGRELRYTYARTPNPPQLVVQVQFIERGGRDTVTRVYDQGTGAEPPGPDEPLPAAAPARPPASLPAAARPSEPAREPDTPRAQEPAKPAPARPWMPGDPPPGQVSPPPAAQTAGLPGQGLPAAPDRAGAPAFAQGPDVELRGLTRLGVVVEGIGAQAAACGLKQAAIEAAAEKSLTDGGLVVVRNTDEDTYLYVQVMTMAASAGLCVSRYDVHLYTHTTATLPYQAVPVLVQVSLLHEGGIAGGAPAAHAEAVLKGVRQAADSFAGRIRKATR